MKWKFAILILFFTVAGLHAQDQPHQDPKDQMAMANEAFEAGQPEVAIMGYEQLLEKGYRSVALFYNLGNAYFKTDQLAEAIINYERALLIDNNETSVLYNISIARAKAEDEIQPLPPFFLVSLVALCDRFVNRMTDVIELASARGCMAAAGSQ